MPKIITHPSAFEFIPERPTIPKLWEAAQGCTGLRPLQERHAGGAGRGSPGGGGLLHRRAAGGSGRSGGQALRGTGRPGARRGAGRGGHPARRSTSPTPSSTSNGSRAARSASMPSRRWGRSRPAGPGWRPSCDRQAAGDRLPRRHRRPVADGPEVQDHRRARQVLRDPLGPLAHRHLPPLGHPADAGRDRPPRGAGAVGGGSAGGGGTVAGGGGFVHRRSDKLPSLQGASMQATNIDDVLRILDGIIAGCKAKSDPLGYFRRSTGRSP